MTMAPASRPGAQVLVGDLLARCTFPPAGTAVTCAVSGGADSTALLALAIAAGCAVTAVHVDHGLRPGSADEAAIVSDSCDRLGAQFRSETVHVGPGPNLEARARSARYAVLPPRVLTGHTADDQAETVLLNVLRGAAGNGLAGMRPGHQRPLLALRRSETEAVCAQLDLLIVHDNSNHDLRFTRNRVRHQVLPLLAETAGRDLVPILARQADVMRDDADLLDELAALIDPTDALALAAAPLPLARRAVRRWLTAHDLEGHPPDLATVHRVLAVASGHVVRCDLTGGFSVERHRQRLSITAPPRDRGAPF
jgi:tRNA(Ile)-lysidine synthase